MGKALKRARTLRGPLGYKRFLVSETSWQGNRQGSEPGHPRSALAHLRALSLRAGPAQHLGDLAEKNWDQT